MKTGTSEDNAIDTGDQFKCNLDTVLAVYSYTTCPVAAPPLACCDDTCGSFGGTCPLASFVSLNVTCGRQYLVRLGTKFGTQGGIGTLKIDCLGVACPPPTGQSCPDCCGGAPRYTDPNFASFLHGHVAIETQSDYAEPDPSLDTVVRIFNLNDMPCPSQPAASNWNPNVAQPFRWPYSDPGNPGTTNDWTRENLGTVFGLTIDARGNLYVAHTTCYYGAGGGGFTALGTLTAGGDSSTTVYKLATDTLLGDPSVFVNLPGGSTGAAGLGEPGLGNLHYACEFGTFYISHLADGRIYRVDETGTILSSFDHATGLPGGGTLEIGTDYTKFALKGERVWGLQAHDGRLYYSVWGQNQKQDIYDHVAPAFASDPIPNRIWSIGLTATGEFTGTRRQEVQLPCNPHNQNGPRRFSSPVSDIAFSADCQMLLAERSMEEDYATSAHRSRFIAYVRNRSAWLPSASNNNGPEAGMIMVDASFWWSQDNSAGGCDFDVATSPGCSAVGGRFWVSADMTVDNNVYGMTGILPSGATPANNVYIDYNSVPSGTADKTKQGDVEIPCYSCGPRPLVDLKFDDNSNIGLDSSGHGHHGNLPPGGATVVSGSACPSHPGGNALNFLPNNGVHEFSIPNSTDLDLTGAMTGMAMIRPHGPQSNGNPSCREGTIFSKGGNYWFCVQEFNNGLMFQNEGSGTDFAIANICLPVNDWAHVAFVRDSNGHGIRFYVNGQFISSSTLALPASANSSDVMVGNYGFNNDPSGCQFNGDLDEIRIYDWALSDAEILAAYSCACPGVECNGVPRFCLPDVDASPCPCGNPPAGGGLGCNNFGACTCNPRSGTLDTSGFAELANDTLVLEVSGMNNTSLTVFFSGTAQVPSVISGAGLRCVGGQLKRLYVGNGTGGAINRPGGGDPSVSARSAALNSPITPGQTRYYYNAYRDPGAAGPCGSAASTFNTTNAVAVTWN